MAIATRSVPAKINQPFMGVRPPRGPRAAMGS